MLKAFEQLAFRCVLATLDSTGILGFNDANLRFPRSFTLRELSEFPQVIFDRYSVISRKPPPSNVLNEKLLE
jgi:hypothetical protein